MSVYQRYSSAPKKSFFIFLTPAMSSSISSTVASKRHPGEACLLQAVARLIGDLYVPNSTVLDVLPFRRATPPNPGSQPLMARSLACAIPVDPSFEGNKGHSSGRMWRGGGS